MHCECYKLKDEIRVEQTFPVDLTEKQVRGRTTDLEIKVRQKKK